MNDIGAKPYVGVFVHDESSSTHNNNKNYTQLKCVEANKNKKNKEEKKKSKEKKIISKLSNVALELAEWFEFGFFEGHSICETQSSQFTTNQKWNHFKGAFVCLCKCFF